MKEPFLKEILAGYNLNAEHCLVETIGNGLINATWKISCEKEDYILQKINTSIFTKPENIADNINQIKQYLSLHHPDYFLVAPVPASNGNFLVKDKLDQHFRLFPFVLNSHTINTVGTAQQAYEAAKQFGKFTASLNGFDSTKLNITLPHFHDLSLRFQQFEKSLKNASKEKLDKANIFIEDIYKNKAIVLQYEAIVKDKLLPLRVIHHDTKISNVLFNDNSKGLCVIDLDTVMPGFIISDVGDMFRTYLSPANEEEKDISKIEIRTDFFRAIVQGYTSEMNGVITTNEKALLLYSGKFMMYMQAIRFLADFLNGDVYYQTHYPAQNLYRAQNQLTLLQHFTDSEKELQKLL